MKVIYEKSMVDKIAEVMQEAHATRQRIHKIVLSRSEMDELCLNLSNGCYTSIPNCPRVVVYKDFSVEEEV
jgi:hypothetical protein